MNAQLRPADLVLSGGGVLAIGHVGAVSVLAERGYRFERVAGTSAGAIVGSLLAARMPVARLREVIAGIDYPGLLDRGLLDHVPLAGPALSILVENGLFEGRRFEQWLETELRALGVRTFADLRREDVEADARPEHRHRLTVMAADVTRGELLRLPADYARYGLDPDEQPVVDAVRASISVPYLYEPHPLRHPGGESLLVDGGIVSNYPIDTFDRTDDRPPRWPTVGVTLLPPFPRGTPRLVPAVRALRLLPGFAFAEALVTTTVVGRDQGFLAQPWVKARSIQVDSLGVHPFDFLADGETIDRLYHSGRRAADAFPE